VHVSKRNEDGVWIRGAKAHQTGCINSHWLLVMPTMRLGSDDRDYAIVGAVPVDAEGITYIYGRQSCDSRAMEDGDIDAGNAKFGGQEAMVIFDDVFIPWENVFMDGEYDFAAMLRRSYVCKSGVGDVLIGAAATAADYNGVENVSHIKEKLVEMTHLNETIYSTGIASSYQASKMKSGVYLNDDMIANVCKHHVTKMPYEIGRLAQDIAGGLMVTAPSQQDFEHPEIGGVIRKYLKGRKDIDVEDRLRILRLIENMTLGRNAVGYLTESMHGAGQMQREFKKQLAKNLAGINSTNAEALADDLSGYMARIFAPTKDDPDI
jgi:4-hydroxybutyryl-CoA dehydratase/vinylacetyl-CoA-Delta-isomerase